MYVRNQKDSHGGRCLVLHSRSSSSPVCMYVCMYVDKSLRNILQVFKLPSYLVFQLKSLEVFILPNILPLCLSLIVICQQLSFVVINIGKGFWRAKLPLFHAKLSYFCIIQFKSLPNLNFT